MTNEIIKNPAVRERLFDIALQTLEMKGYYGINIHLEGITPDNLDGIAKYIKEYAERFHSEGYRIVITITPIMNIDTPRVYFEKIDYSKLSESVDGIAFTSHDWARNYGYPSSIYPINALRELLDYAVSIIPSELIFLGITTLGYDWTLPYVPGATGATIITNENAVQIAANNGIPIQFNEAAQSPFFFYVDDSGVMHVVWFKDARSFNARVGLAEEYDLQGLALWTIMRYNTQMWFIINAQYYIEKL